MLYRFEGVLLSAKLQLESTKKDGRQNHPSLCGEYRARTDDLLHAMQAL